MQGSVSHTSEEIKPARGVRRVLIVDDHELVRWSLRQVLGRRDDVEVCGEADTEDEAFRLIEATRPDVVLVDIRLKAGNGLNLLRRAREANLPPRFLVISSLDDEGCVEQSLLAGAAGFVSKGKSIEVLAEAVNCVLSGEVYYDQNLGDRLSPCRPALPKACSRRANWRSSASLGRASPRATWPSG
jgi:DNA-binding NarL/FixJ family response regulator